MRESEGGVRSQDEGKSGMSGGGMRENGLEMRRGMWEIGGEGMGGMRANCEGYEGEGGVRVGMLRRDEGKGGMRVREEGKGGYEGEG